MFHKTTALLLTTSLLALVACQNTKKSNQPLADVPPAPSDASAEVYTPPQPYEDTASSDIPAADYTSATPVTSSYSPSPGPAPAAPAASTTNYGGGGQSYTVQRGDTLWSISRRYYGTGKEWRRIASANGISNERKLVIGQTLVIP